MRQREEQAAQLLAEGRYQYREIAENIGITLKTLHNWRKDPAFAERVEKISSEFAARALKRAVAKREYRVNTLSNLHSKLLTVIEERAIAPGMDEVPGGKTGLLVRSPIMSGGKVVGVEYAVDTALIKEIRGIQEQVAKELGQLVERHETKISLRDMTDEQLAALLAEASGEPGGTPEGATKMIQ